MKSWMEQLAVIMAFLGAAVAGLGLAVAAPGLLDAPKDQLGAEWLVAKSLVFVGGAVMAGLGGIMWALLRPRPGPPAGEASA